MNSFVHWFTATYYPRSSGLPLPLAATFIDAYRQKCLLFAANLPALFLHRRSENSIVAVQIAWVLQFRQHFSQKLSSELDAAQEVVATH